MSQKLIKAREDWSGRIFANNWEIQEKLNCAEYRKIYQEQTGDMTKKIKNSHYRCYNKNCGVTTYIERTVIQRAMDANRDCLSKCAGCNGEKAGECHYSTQCRNKPLYKTPDRTVKVKVGDTIGLWKILSTKGSGLSSQHQCTALCECLNCGRKKEHIFSSLVSYNAACECTRGHSSGEFLVKKCLDNLNVHYQTELTFDNLVGTSGGKLRYDFGILSENNDVIALIEFDGQQHMEEAGTFYNEDGLVQIHDEIKNKYAKDNNIPLLRIPYYDANKISDLVVNFLEKKS